MTRTQVELLKNATPMAEKKIRQARALQAVEAREMVKQAVIAISAKIRRNKKPARRNAEA